MLLTAASKLVSQVEAALPVSYSLDSLRNTTVIQVRGIPGSLLGPCMASPQRPECKLGRLEVVSLRSNALVPADVHCILCLPERAGAWRFLAACQQR